MEMLLKSRRRAIQHGAAAMNALPLTLKAPMLPRLPGRGVRNASGLRECCSAKDRANKVNARTPKTLLLFYNAMLKTPPRRLS